MLLALTGLRKNKVSLGFVEGLNNKIRVLQRRAYGLRNEDSPALPKRSPFLAMYLATVDWLLDIMRANAQPVQVRRLAR
jgi:hypothetical protein